MGVITTLSHDIHKTYLKWQGNPVIIGFEHFERGVWEVPFPAITICPENKFELRYVEEMNDSDSLFAFKEICPNSGYNFNIDSKESTTNESKSYMETLKEFTMPIIDKVKKSSFKNRNANRFLGEIITDVGNCLTFNLLNESFIFNPDHVDPNYLNDIFEKKMEKTNFNFSPKRWSAEEGYDTMFSQITYPLRTISSNIDLGFHIDLVLSERNNLAKCSNLNGFKVSAHFPGDWPTLKHRYLSFPYGKKGSIVVKPQMTFISDSLKDYDPTV